VPELFTVALATPMKQSQPVPSFVRFDPGLSTETVLSRCSKTLGLQGREPV
jgi:hypothetical protein